MIENDIFLMIELAIQIERFLIHGHQLDSLKNEENK
jgi:hypothetical protein